MRHGGLLTISATILILSLSADASALIVTKREATSHIWLAPEGDANRAEQLTTGNFRQDGNPSVNWTPDGRIIFDSTASGSVHTWIMNADGSDQRQLTDGANEDQGAHVSHDGRYIVSPLIARAPNTFTEWTLMGTI